MLEGGWWWLGASHPPPNLPPKRGEGPEREARAKFGGGAIRRAANRPTRYPPRRTKQHAPHTYPKKIQSLPPFRGEVRWGVGCCELATPLVRAPIVHATPPTATLHIAAAVIPARRLRHPRAKPSFLRAVSVIPAQAGMVGEAIGVLEGVGRRSGLPTPHLASPLNVVTTEVWDT